MLPPSFIDYVLSRDLADGVFVTGCSAGACHNRLGVRWMKDRIARQRDPHLRQRVPHQRLAVCWPAPSAPRRVERELAAFAERLAGLAPYATGRRARTAAKTTEPAT
jgi:coenzyme F420-reducing hydrogenase delta subunit